MANNTASNIDKKVLKSIEKGFQSNRVTTKTINLDNIKGAHTSSTGDTIYRKRKTSYRATSSATGDISGSAPGNDILIGQIPYVVQDIETVDVEWNAVEEALELNQLDELVGGPMGEELVTAVELKVNDFMVKNSGLTFGTPGTVVTDWEEVAYTKALMDEIGVSMSGQRYYQMNNFTSAKLAGQLTGLSADARVNTAWENAVVKGPVAGMTAVSSNTLKSITNGTTTDRAGALDANPDVTWATHKDTMVQSIAVNGFSAGLTIKAGEVIAVTGRYHTNPRTQQVLLDETGAEITFKWTVTADVTLDGSGEGTVLVTNAAIFDAASNNQYDNVSSAPVATDVITLLGSASDVVKPNLAYHKDAFSFATIELPKLYATDSTYRSNDGLTYRVSRYSDGAANKQQMRIDIMYAIGVTNPLYAVRAYGTP